MEEMSASTELSLGRTDASAREGLRKSLGMALHVDLSSFSDEKLDDLTERISLGDVSGVSDCAKVSRGHAIQGIRSYCEQVASGRTTRKLLKTPDARGLAKEILEIFSNEASSKVAQEKIVLLDYGAILPRDAISKRLHGWLLALEGYQSLEANGKIGRLRSILESSGKTSTQRITNEGLTSDLMQYFSYRLSYLEAAKAILAEFPESKMIASTLSGIDVKGISEILRLLNSVSQTSLPDAEAIISDAELEINEKLRRGGRGLDQFSAKSFIEDQISGIASALKMNAEEETRFAKGVLERLAVPVELNNRATRAVLEAWRTRYTSEMAKEMSKIENALRKYRSLVKEITEKLIGLDESIAVASVMNKYSMKVPLIGSDGTGFSNGRNLVLLHDKAVGKTTSEVLPISYSVGKTSLIAQIAVPRNVVVLTGANSGGKTTLLSTVASIHILSIFGLPVPADSAETNLVPIYLFRRRTTKRIGSLEQALSSLIPVFADRQPKLVLIDEFEALTEPGAAGSIVATIMNHVATGSTLVLFVTHLAAEILPHVKMPIRVDGIEATGIDEKGTLIVNRQPKFNHIGSSTPQHIITKLSRENSGQLRRKRRIRASKQIAALYSEILTSLAQESSSAYQTPLALPWISSGE